MTGELFLKYMKHFVEYSHASLAHLVILILYGHSSHKNVEAVEYARANGVIILCLPPHTTHHMQPLDVAVSGPMRSYFDREIGKWLNNHVGRAHGLRPISGIFSQVYDRSATKANAIAGFTACGIGPYNSEIFPNHLFLPLEPSNRPLPQPVIQSSDSQVAQSSPLPVVQPTPSLAIQKNSISSMESPASSSEPTPSTSTNSSEPSVSPLNDILEGIRSIPVIDPNTTVRKRKRKDAHVVTASPELMELKEVQNRVVAKSAKIKKKLFPQPKKNTQKKVRPARKISIKANYKQNKEGEISDPDSGDDDAACIYCNSIYSSSKTREKWIRYDQCLNWANSECAGVDRFTKSFICDICT